MNLSKSLHVTLKSKPTPTLNVAVGGKSIAGLRAEDQDAFAVNQPKNHNAVTYKGITACIADGASCSHNGQQASQLSVTQFITDYYATPDTWSVKQSARRVLMALNDWLYHHSQLTPLRHNGFITTLSCVILKANRAHIFHVGDTRIYRLREGVLTTLTRDHCYKSLNKESYLTRALGIDSHLEIDYQDIGIRCDDVFVLTSDGVHQWMSDLELTRLLTKESTELEIIADDVLQYALEKGSDDNLTCLLLKVTSLPVADLDELNVTGSSKVFPPALAVGHRIDRFIVLKVLHSGSRSHVYLVEDNNSKQRIILKAPSLNYSGDIHFIQSFMREKWVGLRASSSELMRIYPHESRFLYHLCEHVEGCTLRQWMDEHPKPSLQTVKELLTKMVKSVRAIQRLGVIHRDLKPENVMINQYQKLILIDYGAVQIESEGDIHQASYETLPLGALEYIAPEYLNEYQALHQSDIFSMGVIIYEILSHHLPYQHNISTGMNKIPLTHWRYTSLLQYRPDLPLWVDLVIRKACHPDYNQRYQAMSEFIADFATPNPTLIDKSYLSSLIEDNPLNLWRTLTFMLLALLILQSLYMIH